MAFSTPRVPYLAEHPALARLYRQKPNVGGPEAQPQAATRRVSPNQWVLLVVSVVLAAAGEYLPELLDVVFLTLVLSGLGLLLLISTAFEALDSRLCGKFLLSAATFLSYWVEAAGLALHDPPFPGSNPVPWSQWPEDMVRTGLLYVTLFQLCLFVGYSVQPNFGTVRRYLAGRLDAPGSGRQFLAYALAACGLIALAASYRDPQRVLQALLAARSGEGPVGEATVLSYLSTLGMYGTSLLMTRAFLFSRKESLLSATPSRVLALLLCLPFVLSGTRHVLLFITLPLVVVYCVKLPHRIRPVRVLWWVLLILLLLAVSQLQAALRGTGWLNFDYGAKSEIVRTDIYGNFTPQLFAQYLVPGVHDYFMEPATPLFFTHFILRRWWPDKPTMRSWEYYNYMWLRQDVKWGNVTPSVTGQYYINWGVAGVILIGAWLGFLSHMADRLLGSVPMEQHTAVAVSIGMFYAFLIASFRLYAPFYFAYFALGIPCMVLVTRNVRAGVRRAAAGYAVPKRARVAAGKES